MSRLDRNNTEENVVMKNKKTRILPSKTYQLVLLLIMAIVAIAFLVMVIVVDAFPAGMTLAFIITMLVMIALAWFLFCRQGKAWRIVGIVVATIFILAYGLGVYYLGTTYTMFNRINSKDTVSQVQADGVDVTNEAFNIYITGIDQWNKEKGLDLERSDVNMIVTVSPKTRKILLTSIPRDSYVKLHTAGEMDKLTHTGVYGVDETLNTVEDWLGIDMNYYVKCNFTSVTKVLFAIGGVDVYSPKAFKSSISVYRYKKGWNHLNGRAALFYARERKAFGEDDSVRVDQQQQVLKAALDKLLTSSTLLTKYDDLIRIAADDLETNMPTEDMQALIKMQLADLGKWDIQTQKIKGEYDMDYVASLTQEEKFLVYKTKTDSVKEVVTKIDDTMHPTSAEIAAATAKRQKNSFFGFIKGVLKK